MPDVSNLDLLIIQAMLIIIAFGIVIWLISLAKVNKLEKRFRKYSVTNLNESELSLFDKFKHMYLNLRKNITKWLYKIKIFNDYSKKYEKYCDNTKIKREDPMDYIATKTLTGFLMVIVILLSYALQYQHIVMIEVLTAFLVGFFIPDLFLFSKTKYRKKQIEKDMLKAIIIMNNSFKSGLSIMQAIYMVSKELDGPISEEFKKMYIDLSYGLNMEVVFERFTNRIDTKEARYITTSLNVLNKTGGNIVQVFASVERNSFTRKKLQDELGALAASASAIFKILVFIPPMLAILIFMLNPMFFAPLFTSAIGWMILFIILVIYILYIIVIKRVMKVKVMM